MSKERLEEITDAIAYLRDEYVDADMISEYYGHDIKAEIVSCPISALSYTGDYIELLQKRVQELEEAIADYAYEIGKRKRALNKKNEQNKRYRGALEEIINARNHFYPTEYVFGVEGIARKALEESE